MKRVYVKPQLLIENFRLTEYIASCGKADGGINVISNFVPPCDQTNTDVDSWADSLYDHDDGYVFAPSLECGMNASELEYGDGQKICYHSATGYDINVFNS